MAKYEFILSFALPPDQPDPDVYVEALYESGFEDAVIGVGRMGQIAICMGREAASADQAVLSAIADVKNLIPGARFIETEPDLVGLTEVAKELGFSRQNMRKLAINNDSFPSPVHGGKPSIWHLATILEWLQANKHYPIDECLLETARTNMQINLLKQLPEIEPATRKQTLALIA